MLPEWASKNLEVGYDYCKLLKDDFQVETMEELAEKDPAELAKLWNLNTVMSEAPYNWTDYKKAVEEWAKHSTRVEAAIPVCILTKDSWDAVKFCRQSQKGMSNDLFPSIPIAKYSQQWALLYTMARTCWTRNKRQWQIAMTHTQRGVRRSRTMMQKVILFDVVPQNTCPFSLFQKTVPSLKNGWVVMIIVYLSPCLWTLILDCELIFPKSQASWSISRKKISSPWIRWFSQRLLSRGALLSRLRMSCSQPWIQYQSPRQLAMSWPIIRPLKTPHRLVTRAAALKASSPISCFGTGLRTISPVHGSIRVLIPPQPRPHLRSCSCLLTCSKCTRIDLAVNLLMPPTTSKDFNWRSDSLD